MSEYKPQPWRLNYPLRKYIKILVWRPALWVGTLWGMAWLLNVEMSWRLILVIAIVDIVTDVDESIGDGRPLMGPYRWLD